MNSRKVLAAIMMACLLTIGLTGFAPAAKAASIGKSLLNNPSVSMKKDVTNIGYRKDNYHFAPGNYPPIAPTYRYYDFPYYYSRGYYPKHIRGYINFLYDYRCDYYYTKYSRRSCYKR